MQNGMDRNLQILNYYRNIASSMIMQISSGLLDPVRIEVIQNIRMVLQCLQTSGEDLTKPDGPGPHLVRILNDSMTKRIYYNQQQALQRSRETTEHQQPNASTQFQMTPELTARYKAQTYILRFILHGRVNAFPDVFSLLVQASAGNQSAYFFEKAMNLLNTYRKMPNAQRTMNPPSENTILEPNNANTPTETNHEQAPMMPSQNPMQFVHSRAPMMPSQSAIQPVRNNQPNLNSASQLKPRFRLELAQQERKRLYELKRQNSMKFHQKNSHKLESQFQLKKFSLLEMQKDVRRKLYKTISQKLKRQYVNNVKVDQVYNSCLSHVEFQYEKIIGSKSDYLEQKNIKEKMHEEFLDLCDRLRKSQQVYEEKGEKEELAALKNNENIELYYNLLQQTKERRIMNLLEQTDLCLKKLGAKFVTQGEDEIVPLEKMHGEIDFTLFKEKLNGYYTFVHQLKESINEQPRTLRHGKLKTYQLHGLEWLLSFHNNNINGILADDMGLGKTIQTISLISYLMEYKVNSGPFLVITPLSLIDNWAREFYLWNPDIVVLKYNGSKDERKRLFTNRVESLNFHVLLVQYESISKDRSFLQTIDWNYLILDEGHRIKNSHHKLLRDLSSYSSQHRLLLTGAPLQKDLKELWSLLNFVFSEDFDTIDHFEKLFRSPFDGNAKANEIVLTEGEHLLIVKILHKILNPFILRREKKQVLDELPEKVEYVVRCPISDMQKIMYKGIKNHLNFNKAGNLRANSLSNTILQLRKVCNHPYLFANNYEIDETFISASGKFVLLDNMLKKLKKTNHRVLIFSQMTEVLTLLGQFLSFRGHTFVRLDGQVKSTDRQNLIDQFNSPDSDSFVFLLSTRASGLGLNLASADTVIIFDSDWNPENDEQAIARAHRIGQTRTVYVFRLITATQVEEHVYETAERKKENQDSQSEQVDCQTPSSQKRQMLEDLLTSESKDFLKDKVPSLDELNAIFGRNHEEINLFRQADLDSPPLPILSSDKFPSWFQEDYKLISGSNDVQLNLGTKKDEKDRKRKSNSQHSISKRPKHSLSSSDDEGLFSTEFDF